MRRIKLLSLLLLLCVIMASCGAKGSEESAGKGALPAAEDLTDITERTEYYDIAVESEEIFRIGLWEKNPPDDFLVNVLLMGDTAYIPLGTQFYHGEPMQLWAEASPEGGDIYLYRKDGNGELLLQGILIQYIFDREGYEWYIDEKGDFYAFYTSRTMEKGEHRIEATFVKILSSGEILYEETLDNGIAIEDFCQTEDGRLYLLLKDDVGRAKLLAEVDPATGSVIRTVQLQMKHDYGAHLGMAGGSPILEAQTVGGEYEMMEVDFSDGSMSTAMSFTGTSYARHNEMDLKSFRMLEDGSLELLWTDKNGASGLYERLQMTKVEKIPITIRGAFYGNTWLAERVTLFNQQSSTYHVVIESCRNADEGEDFARLTSVQIAAGKGPDILSGDFFLWDYVGGMLEKGALEELNSYMEDSGIREEDYFPATFATWRDGEMIYSVNVRLNLSLDVMDADIMGGGEVSDIDTLVDALLSQEEDGVYMQGNDSVRVLRSFLLGTESIWGMVDWEKGDCDFDDPLFAKLLEVARRYGDDGRKNTDSSIAESIFIYHIYRFTSFAERESAGKVISGVLFDDGCHVASIPSQFTMMINKNSSHKEGAWEFICFLLGEEVQTLRMEQNSESYTPVPVNRKAFERWLKYVTTQDEKHIMNDPAWQFTEEKKGGVQRGGRGCETPPHQNGSHSYHYP